MPVFGPGEICVFIENNTFRVVTNTTTISCTAKEEVYQYVVRNELKQKYYVLKPIKMSYRYAHGNRQYLVTVHRKSASVEWDLVSYTEKIKTLNGRDLFWYYRHEIRNLSLLVANKLGESFPECNTIVIEIVYDMEQSIWIQDTVLHFFRSKWSQYLTLVTNKELEPYVPDTDLLTKVTFNNYLNRYRKVIIKPCDGKEGVGIVQVSLKHDLSYEIHFGIKRIRTMNLEETYRFLEKKFLSEKYTIIQQRLPLATINNCPIDSRIIVQKVDSTWRTTGKIVKVAGEGFIIANAAQDLISLEKAIQDSNIQVTIYKLEVKIDEICIAAARQLEENSTGVTIIGFDIGITDLGDIWIIEGNHNPNLSMFNMLEDKRTYLKIMNAKRG